jgi:hypothetical protein
MPTLKFAVAILFVGLAANTCTWAGAQDEQQPAAAVTVSLNDNLDECYRPTCNNPCPTVYGQVDALFLKRVPRVTSQQIVVDPNGNTTYLSTSDLDFNFDPGVRTTFGVRLCEGRALEFSYFGLFEGDASAVAVKPTANAFLIFPDNVVGNVFVGMDRTEVKYSSWVNSFEMNFPCCCGCCDQCAGAQVSDDCSCRAVSEACGQGPVRCRSFEWFAGFRYFNLGEELNITAQKMVAGAAEEGTYNLRTDNQLYGGQLGARLRRWRERIGWEATGKAGLFANVADQKQTVTDFPNFPLRPTVSSSSSGVAFVGELNLSALYRLNDVWNLRGGYNVLWIEGLALAPDQLDFNFASATGGTQLNNGGGMLLHGVNLGLEARW